MKTKPIEIRPPGYMLKDLNEEFMKEWTVKYAVLSKEVEMHKR